jgi:hypothetical protein
MLGGGRVTWLDEEARLRAQLEEIDTGGYAFDLIGTHVKPPRQENGRRWRPVADWEPPEPRPVKAERQPRPAREPKPPRPPKIPRRVKPSARPKLPKAPKPPKPVKTARPVKVRAERSAPARKVATAPVICYAPDAFAGFSYPGCFTEAERRLKAGAHQAKCVACMRYRWADEPCDAAMFKGGKGPRPERVNS